MTRILAVAFLTTTFASLALADGGGMPPPPIIKPPIPEMIALDDGGGMPPPPSIIAAAEFSV